MTKSHKECETCKGIFTWPSYSGKLLSTPSWLKRRYCSNKCAPAKGSKNENHGHWKGDKVTYAPLHKWVRQNFGRPQTCEICNLSNPESGRSKIHWANKDHKYSRESEQWIPLCPSCHYSYDRNKGFRITRKKSIA